MYLGRFQGSGRLARCRLSRSDMRRMNRRAVQIRRGTSGGGWVDCRTSGQMAGSNFRAARRLCVGTGRKVVRLVRTAGWVRQPPHSERRARTECETTSR